MDNDLCACGCGDQTKGGDFMPGHDQKMRSDLERRVGGLINLSLLVQAAEAHVYQGGSDGMLSGMVKTIFRDPNI